jgi:hypothetical protein
MKRGILLLFASLNAYGEEVNLPEPLPPSPWFTGPLLSQPGTVTPRGDFSIQPFLFVTANTGSYDTHWNSHSTPTFYTTNPALFVIVGLTEWMDFQLYPQALYNTTQGESSFHFGDFFAAFDFQLITPDRWKWIPGIKLMIGETFPTGKYQHLDPKKKDTDLSGQGTYATDIALVLYKVIHIKAHHFLSTTLSFDAIFSTPVRVSGLNAYGGSPGMKGTARPGNQYIALLSFEYTFNQNWVFAIDNSYTHIDKTHLKGNQVVRAQRSPLNTSINSSEQFSLAPAIEYNFSAQAGLIAGAWFTVAGRNSTRFEGGAISFVYVY